MSAGMLPNKLDLEMNGERLATEKNRGYCGNQTMTNEYIMPKNKLMSQ